MIGKAKSKMTGAVVACAECGNQVYRKASRIEKAEQNFCSLTCTNKYQGRSKVEHSCTVCGSKFKWSPSRTKPYDVKYCSIKCRDADPKKRDQLIAMNMYQQQGKRTSCERLGYALLDALGCEYVAQHLIGGKFCVDAFLPGPRIVVQFDGDYWHGNRDKFPALDARQQRRVKLDQSQDAYMHACGFLVVRIWHSELQRDRDGARTRLQRVIYQAAASGALTLSAETSANERPSESKTAVFPV